MSDLLEVSDLLLKQQRSLRKALAANKQLAKANDSVMEHVDSMGRTMAEYEKRIISLTGQVNALTKQLALANEDTELLIETLTGKHDDADLRFALEQHKKRVEGK